MILDSIIELRRTLHSCPELPGQEFQTKSVLIDFLTQNTSLEIHSCGNGFYAAHRECSPNKSSIALRADYDAVPLPDGTAGHLCGHDGHAATLCGVALTIEGNTYDRNIFLLFQPAEETGEGAEMGKKAFGSAASNAEIWLTLRAEHDVDLASLHDRILAYAHHLAEDQQLDFSYQTQDVFPATANNPCCAQKVLDLLHGVPLEKPMRWSEDFGHYLKKCSGAFFGIGAGEAHPALHTKNYEYPDELLQPAMNSFLTLIQHEIITSI